MNYLSDIFKIALLTLERLGCNKQIIENLKDSWNNTIEQYTNHEKIK